jgi:hypothetical protein
LHKEYLAYTVSQAQFNLQNSLTAASEFPYLVSPWPMEDYKKAIKEMIEQIIKSKQT